MRDYKDGRGQSDQRADQHAPPQGAIEDLLTHQEGQLEQQSIRPEKKTKQGEGLCISPPTAIKVHHLR